MLRLVVHIPGEPDRSFEVRARALIGRSSGCDLQIVGRHVSKEHALIEIEAGGATIRDAGSTNGVEVNGVRVEGEHLLRGGDEIVLGDAWLTVDPASPLLAGRPRAPVTYAQLTARQRIMAEHSRREEEAFQRRSHARRNEEKRSDELHAARRPESTRETTSKSDQQAADQQAAGQQAVEQEAVEQEAATQWNASRLVGRPVQQRGDEPILRVLSIAGPPGPREVFRIDPFLCELESGEVVWIWPQGPLAPVRLPIDRIGDPTGTDAGFEISTTARVAEPEDAPTYGRAGAKAGAMTGPMAAGAAAGAAILGRKAYRLPARIAVVGAVVRARGDDGRRIFSERAPDHPLEIVAIDG